MLHHIFTRLVVHKIIVIHNNNIYIISVEVFLNSSWTGRGLQLVVFGPGELVVRNEPVLVLVLVLEYLLDEFLVVGHHLLDVIAALGAFGRGHLLLEVFAHLVSGQPLVLVLVDLLEHVRGRCLVADVQQFDVEDQRGTCAKKNQFNIDCGTCNNTNNHHDNNTHTHTQDMYRVKVENVRETINNIIVNYFLSFVGTRLISLTIISLLSNYAEVTLNFSALTPHRRRINYIYIYVICKYYVYCITHR